MTYEYYRPETDQKSRASRVFEGLRAAAKTKIGRAAVAAAAVSASSAGIFGLAEASGSHKTGPQYSAQTEDGLQRVLQPKMAKIADGVLELQKNDPTEILTKQVGPGIVAVSGAHINKDGQFAGVTAIMKVDANGQADPNKVLGVDLLLADNPNNDRPKGGNFSSTQLSAWAPNGVKYFSQGNGYEAFMSQQGGGNWAGWNASYDHIEGTNGTINVEHSGLVDTASPQDFAPDSDDPVSTAQFIVDNPLTDGEDPLLEEVTGVFHAA